MSPLVLIVDDEEENRAFLKGCLEARGFKTLIAGQAEEAWPLVRGRKPDLILSDVAMPGCSGLEFCRRLKSDPGACAIPIILMSGAHRAQADQAGGIELGADDYLPKPFTPRLMIAKIEGLLRRRPSQASSAEVFRLPGLTLDVEARLVRSGGALVPLTRKEFDLLAAFLRKPGKALSTSFLLESVWGYDPAVYNDPHTVETHVSCLRRKLGARLGALIVSVSGIGYRFDGRPALKA